MTEESDARDLADAAQVLTAEIEGRFVTKRAFWLAVTVGVVAIALLVATTLGNRVVVGDLRRQTDLLTECTTPDPDPSDGDPHECYEQGQRSQQAAIEQISENFAAQLDAAIDRVLRSLGITPVHP